MQLSYNNIGLCDFVLIGWQINQPKSVLVGDLEVIVISRA